MGVIYLASLIVGLGIIAVQLLLSGDSGADAHSDLGVDVHHDLHGLDAASDVEQAGPGQALESALPADGIGVSAAAIFMSLRFWTFGLMAFGLLGSFLHYLDLASRLVTVVAAAVLGLCSGWFASYVFLTLMRSNPNSGVDSAALVGQIGKVLLPPNSSGRAKIRLRVKGQIIDYLATADEPLGAGASVLVEEVRGEQVHVSLAPEGLAYEE